MKKGVKPGYRENWAYKGRWSEVKTAPGTWKIDFKATKNRKAEMGGLKPGTKILWKITAYQTAIKTNKGHIILSSPRY